MTNQIIKIAQALSKIKGMEKSPYVLIKVHNIHVVQRYHAELYHKGTENYGPWLNNSSFDGAWSSAKIREGLGISVYFSQETESWRVYVAGNWHGSLNLTDPAADDLANILGIIEYWKQFPQEVEKHLEGLG